MPLNFSEIPCGDISRVALATTAFAIVAVPAIKAERAATFAHVCFTVALTLSTSMTLIAVFAPAGAASEPVAILISVACNVLAAAAGLWLGGQVTTLPAFTRRELMKLATLGGTVVTSLSMAPAAEVNVVSQLDCVCSAATLAFLCSQVGRSYVAAGQARMANLAVVAAVFSVTGQALFLSASVARPIAGIGLVTLAYLVANLPRPAPSYPVAA